MDIDLLRQRGQAFFARPSVTRAGKWLGRLFLVSICGLLAWRLSRIGWTEIWQELPTHPIFYLIFFIQYLTLPVSEWMVYRSAWGFRSLRHLSAFVRKRIYNKDVFGYSGEVYLYTWSRKNLGLSDSRILRTIKDNTIVSSVVSTLVSFGILGTLLLANQVHLPDGLVSNNVLEIGGGVALAAAVIAVGIRFRKAIFYLSGPVLLSIVVVHVVRLLTANVLQVTQWSVAIPEIPLQAWFTLLAAQILASRVPFLPGREILFLSASVELAHLMNVPAAAVFGVLGVTTVMDKLLNFILFPLLHRLDRKRTDPVASERVAVNAGIESQPV
jgi:hypothetical protein